jgi:hypothetical protein
MPRFSTPIAGTVAATPSMTRVNWRTAMKYLVVASLLLVVAPSQFGCKAVTAGAIGAGVGAAVERDRRQDEDRERDRDRRND